MRAARNYEGTAWVAYDRQYRREALAGKCLNWSRVKPRLYSEAFTGRAKAIPRCHQCLSDTHTLSACPLAAPGGNPDQVLRPTGDLQRVQGRPLRVYYRHVCSGCSYPHPWSRCPKNSSKEEGHDRGRSRSPSRKGGKW